MNTHGSFESVWRNCFRYEFLFEVGNAQDRKSRKTAQRLGQGEGAASGSGDRVFGTSRHGVSGDQAKDKKRKQYRTMHEVASPPMGCGLAV